MGSKSMKKKIRKKTSKSIRSEKILTITIATVLILLILLFAYQRNNNLNYNNIKKEKSLPLIYTKYTNENKSNVQYPKSIPEVNIDHPAIDKINKQIIEFCDEYTQKEKSVINYEYDINGIFLSLVIKISDNEMEYAPEVYFRTYNINLEETQAVSNTYLLGMYDIDEKEVETKIESQLKKYYAQEVKKKYFATEECSYECFLTWRGIENYLDGVQYYIKDGKLIAFKPFIVHSIFGEENYFKEEHFEFEIAEEPVVE